MSEQSVEPVMIGKPLTPKEKFFLSWAEQSLSSALPFVNEVLRHLVTLTSTLLGGSIVFLSADMIGKTPHLLAVVGFFLALALSFIGMMPFSGHIDFQDPARNEEHLTSTLKMKMRLCRAAGLLILAGFVCAIVGLLIKGT